MWLMKISLSLGIQACNNALTFVSSLVYTGLSWLHTCRNQNEVQLDSYLGTLGRICFQAYSSCWQNSVLGGRSSQVAVFLLLVSQGSSVASTSHPHFLAHSPLPSSLKGINSKSFLCSKCLSSFSLPPLLPSPCATRPQLVP